MCMSAFELNKR